MYVCVSVHRCTMWKSQDNLQDLVLSLHHVVSRDLAQVIRLPGKCLPRCAKTRPACNELQKGFEQQNYSSFLSSRWLLNNISLQWPNSNYFLRAVFWNLMAKNIFKALFCLLLLLLFFFFFFFFFKLGRVLSLFRESINQGFVCQGPHMVLFCWLHHGKTVQTKPGRTAVPNHHQLQNTQE